MCPQKAKFNVLVAMLRRLYSLASGATTADSADSQANQELLLPGHLYTAFFKVRCSLLHPIVCFSARTVVKDSACFLTIYRESVMSGARVL